MKKLYIYLLLSVCSLAIHAQGYVIHGSVEGVKEGVAILHSFFRDGNEQIDSIRFSKGKFEFRGPVTKAIPASITVNNKRNSMRLYLENTTYTIKINTNNRSKNTIKGSKLTNEWHTLTKQQEGESDDKHFKRLERWVVDNPTSLFTPDIIASFLSYAWNYDDLRRTLNTLKGEPLNSFHYLKLREREEGLKKLIVGNKAPDFSQSTPDGKSINLYRFLRGKQYLLIDFWAAWCPDCRVDNPNIVKAWQTYNSMGFDVLGVSLDFKKEAWLKAIETDDLTWTHVSDLKYWDNAAAKLYMVNAIPSNILLDKNGIIVARNLNGDALMETLAGLFQEKKYLVKGEIEGLVDSEVTLTTFLADGESKSFKAKSSNGKFSFEGRLQEACFACIQLPITDGNYCFFLDNEGITLKGNINSKDDFQLTGSKINDNFSVFIRPCETDNNPIACLLEKVKQNPSSIYAAPIIANAIAPQLSVSELKELVSSLKPPATRMYQYYILQEHIAEEEKKQQLGDKAPNFSLPQPNGIEISLYEFILGKKYVLVDFWAAWCRPCRRENPTLVEAYKKYNDSGFDIFGVSLDRDRSAWEKAIETDGLVWANVSDLGFWNSMVVGLYGIKSIPQNVLLNQQGEIIARNLRGQDLIETLDRLFQNEKK